MKIILLSSISLLFIFTAQCQVELFQEKDKLLSSIAYDGTLWGNNYGRKMKYDEIDHRNYPDNLKDSKLFYIELNSMETAGNTGTIGPNYEKINSILNQKLTESFSQFQTFPNEALSLGTDYFKDEGFTHRVLIQSRWWVSRREYGQDIQMSQGFLIVIQDIDTGELYCGEEYFRKLRKTLRRFISKVSYS